MMKAIKQKSMEPSVDIVWFDWKESEQLVQFIQDMTAKTPMCFRQVKTGEDSYVLVFSERPVSQREADAFYIQTIEGSKITKHKA